MTASSRLRACLWTALVLALAAPSVAGAPADCRPNKSCESEPAPPPEPGCLVGTYPWPRFQLGDGSGLSYRINPKFYGFEDRPFPVCLPAA